MSYKSHSQDDVIDPVYRVVEPESAGIWPEEPKRSVRGFALQTGSTPGPLSAFNFSAAWPESAPLASRTQAILEQANPACPWVEYVGTMPLFRGHMLAPGQEFDWVLVALADDPLFSHPGGFPIPKHARDDLERIRDTGIEFDSLYVAHEVKKGAVQPDAPLTYSALKPPPPRAVQKLSHRLGKRAASLWSGGSRPISVSPFLIGAAALGAIAALPAAMAAASALPLLVTVDPIVLGVVTSPGSEARSGNQAAWLYLTHWNYGEDE